jgi:transglutaminase/protease-like cytokinesis protein 3
MKRNLLFNQTTAIGKRLAMVLTMLLIVGIGQAWGETYLLGWGSASGTAGAYTNFTTTSGTVNNIVSFSTAKNSGSAPAYNSNNSELRLYYASNGSGGSITLTPATGITITGFVMTTSTAPTVKYKVGSGNLTTVSKASNANTYTVSNITATSSSALTIQNANTSNTQLRIKTIQITYTKSGGNTSVSSVSLNHSTLSLEVGETSTLIATVLPNNATNKTVTWSSSNAAVATVSDGVVAAVSAGSTTITVKTEDGDKTATCNVTVTAPAGGGGSSDGECTWELVTDASDLKAGDQIVITSAEVDMALSTTQQTNNRTGTAITKTNNKLEINSRSYRISSLP